MNQPLPRARCSVAREIESRRVYFIEDGRLRHVVDPVCTAVLTAFFGPIPRLSARALAAAGSPASSFHLVRDAQGSIWFVDGCRKYPLVGVTPPLEAQAQMLEALEPAFGRLPHGGARIELKAELSGTGPTAQLAPCPEAEEPAAADAPGYDALVHRPTDAAAASRPYHNYAEWLCAASTHSNLVRRPLAEADRRVLGVMDWHRRALAVRFASAPQDRLVSVVMPVFNRAAVLSRAVASVLAQRYKNLELLIVDDGSRDDTPAVLGALTDPRVRRERLEPNQGAAAARNRALSRAAGRYIAYLDSDDYWDPDFLTIMVGTLREQGFRAGYAALKIWLERDPASGDGRRLQGVRFSPFNRSLLENSNFISPITLLHERSLLDKSGLFDEGLRRLNDWDLILRLTAEDFPVALPVPLAHCVRGEDAGRISDTEDFRAPQKLIREKLRAARPLESCFPAAAPPLARGLHALPGAPRAGGYTRPITVIIPNYEALPFLQACVEALFAFTPAGFRLHIVDNRSGDETRQYLLRLQKARGAAVTFNPENLGFSQAVNIGLMDSPPGNDVVLMNNDAMVTPGWLEALQEVMADHAEAGIAVPRQVLPADTQTINLHVPGADSAFEADASLSAHHCSVLDPFLNPVKGFVELSFAPFFCVYLRRELIDRCGPLDAVNGPHYRSDRLYCDVARSLAGSKIVYTPHAKIYHFHQQATADLRRNDPAAFDRLYRQNTPAAVSEEIKTDQEAESKKSVSDTVFSAVPGPDATDELCRRLDRLQNALAAKELEIQSLTLRAAEEPAAVSAPKPGRLGRALGRLGLYQRLAERREVKLINRQCGFDADWYRQRHPDVADAGLDPLLHYLRFGAREGRDPGPHFSTLWYLRRYPDVGASGLNPLVHYLKWGKAEGRAPAPPTPAAEASAAGPSQAGPPEDIWVLPVERLRAAPRPCGAKIAVQLHFCDEALVDELCRGLQNIPYPFDLFISLPPDLAIDRILQPFKRQLALCRRLEAQRVEPGGGDLPPLIWEFGPALLKYDLIGHLFNRILPHTPANWNRHQYLLAHMLGSERTVEASLCELWEDAQLGLLMPLCPPGAEAASTAACAAALQLARRMELAFDPAVPGIHPNGSMFWAKAAALKKVLGAGAAVRQAEEPPGGGPAEAWELILGAAARDAGFTARRFTLEVEPRLLHFFNADRPYRDGREEAGQEAELLAHRQFRGRRRIALCTAIAGGYDELMLPERIDAEVDYVCFADRPLADQGLWRILPLEFHSADPVRSARYVKTHLHHYFPDYDAVIWMDANILMRGDLQTYLRNTELGGAVMGAIPHPRRTSIYEEAEECLRSSRDQADRIKEQMHRYHAEGYRPGERICETGFIVLRGWPLPLQKALDDWWGEISRFSRRDQLSLEYVLERRGVQWRPLLPEGQTVRTHPDFALFGHGRDSGYARPVFAAQYSRTVDPAAGPRFAAVRTEALAALHHISIDIVVCVHNALDDVRACLASVEKHLGPRQRVIIVDDRSDYDTMRYLREFARGKPHVLRLRLGRRSYYTAAVNAGLKAANADFVILLNSDTIVSADWALKLAHCAWSHPRNGVVGPLSNAASHQSLPRIASRGGQTAVNRLRPGVTPAQVDRACEELAPAHLFPVVPLVHGFCLGIKREVLERVGAFDAASFPQGFGEEDDFCLRAQDAGYRLAIAAHTFVYHAKSKSYSAAGRFAIARQSAETLRRKHHPHRIEQAVADARSNYLLQRMREGTAAWFEPEEPAPAAAPRAGEGRWASEGRLLKLAEISAAELEANLAALAVKPKPRPGGPPTALWFIPFAAHALKGGVRTIFSTAQHLSRRFGTRHTFVVDDIFSSCGAAEMTGLEQSLKLNFPELACTLIRFRRDADDLRLLPRAEIGFCTLWTTAYLLARMPACRRKFYFMQDFEPLFYEAGSLYGAIEATYRFGFACIANTEGVAERYRRGSPDVLAFAPGVDRAVYAPNPDLRFAPPFQLVFYGRPHNARNGFMLGLETLRRVKAALGEKVRIIAVGADWQPADFDAAGIVECRGLLRSLAEVAELYRSSHLGLVFMFTPHPSYQPLEYMASGCVTVTNRNAGTAWLLKDGENCAIVDPVPGLAADRIVRLLADDAALKALREGGLRTAAAQSWERAYQQIEDFILQRSGFTG